MPTRSVAPAPAHALAAPPSAPAPTHGCVRCGTAIPIEDAMCERCNPLGLRQPAASQAHGIAILAMMLAVVVLAVVARVATVGVGPFAAQVADAVASDGGLTVTLSVTNQGSTDSAVACRVARANEVGLSPDAAIVQSPRIGAGKTVTFQATVTSLGTEIRPLAVTCGGR